MEEASDVSKVKEKPGNAQNMETPRIVTPIEFHKVKVQEIFKDEREQYVMNLDILENIDCKTCKLIYDYT